MYRMDKLTTGIAYGASAGNAGYFPFAAQLSALAV